MDKSQQLMAKRSVAEAALEWVKQDMLVGVGSGSTVDCFIDVLAGLRGRIDGVVAASEATAARLKAHGMAVLALTAIDRLALYVDGADEINPQFQLLKGAGGAMTREKIIAASADCFLCIVDQTKEVTALGTQPLPVEVLPMARSVVGRALVKLGGHPAWRGGFTTDNGNQIIDVFGLPFTEPIALEQQINQIPGVVGHGLFASRGADIVLIGRTDGVVRKDNPTPMRA